MLKTLNHIIKAKHPLALFYVFTGECVNELPCIGNPALVILTNKLPTLQEHIELIRALKSDDNQQAMPPDNVTFTYIGPHTCDFSIRWFSSSNIITRCGHGTMAAAAFANKYLLRNKPSNAGTTVYFHSDKESLKVNIGQDNAQSQLLNNYILSLPYEQLLPSDHQQYFDNNIVRECKTAEQDGYLIIELTSEKEVTNFVLTKPIIAMINKRALIITARSRASSYDIVFRYFAPFYGELEDGATGSAGSLLMPFWQHLCTSKQEQSSDSFNNTLSLRCYQASKSGGFFMLSNNKQSSVNVAGYVKEDKV